ncbi:hypothetical protein XELAEV_18000607mg [Xenopus laevis]|nr:hypothetical protein XELAEV_18000607mg [Xenopus laevis]
MRQLMSPMDGHLHDINLSIHREFQDPVVVLEAQPHQPQGSAEGQAPGPSAAPPPPPEAPQQWRGRVCGMEQGPVQGDKRKHP